MSKVLNERKTKMQPRMNLKANVLYFDTKSEQYFYTPSAPGVIWLTPQEADYMFDADVDAIIVELESI